jgi:hypothetical protein
MGSGAVFGPSGRRTFLSGAITYLYMESHVLWAAVLAAVFFFVSLAYTFFEGKA